MRVGALNFSANDWVDWYPEDLPESWRLHFYGGEYRAVCLSRSVWLRWSDEICLSLDWPDHLSVFVEVAAEDVPRWQSVRAAWQSNGLGVAGVVSPDASVVAACEDSAALMKLKEGGWDARFVGYSVSGIETGVHDLKLLRRQIEASAAWETVDGVLLFRATPDQLEAANTLVHLLY